MSKNYQETGRFLSKKQTNKQPKKIQILAVRTGVRAHTDATYATVNIRLPGTLQVLPSSQYSSLHEHK